MVNLFFIALGGAAGSLSRYGLGLAIQHWLPSQFPFATMVVNLLGCFLFGVVAGLVERGNLVSPAAEMALLVGFLGAFTTFSTFAFHNTLMLQDGKLMWFAANIMVQNVAGIAVLFAGLALTRP
ncbi:MAG: hypothetical protein RLZZ303_400 [Candidatus Hydrogenedentota bacterium]|jgi:CrcB protein